MECTFTYHVLWYPDKPSATQDSAEICLKCVVICSRPMNLKLIAFTVFFLAQSASHILFQPHQFSCFPSLILHPFLSWLLHWFLLSWNAFTSDSARFLLTHHLYIFTSSVYPDFLHSTHYIWLYRMFDIFLWFLIALCENKNFVYFVCCIPSTQNS